jgi:acetyl esterase
MGHIKSKLAGGFIEGVMGSAQFIAERLSPLLAKRYPVTRVRDQKVTGFDGHSIPIDLYIPSGPRPEKGWPLAYVIHGGGFRFFSKESHASIAARIASMGYLAVVVGYRKTPAHPFPAAFNDVFAVYHWAHSSIGFFGGTMEGAIVSGESAGGNFTLAVTLAALGVPEFAARIPGGASWKVPERIIVNCPYLEVSAEERVKRGAHSRIVAYRFGMIQRSYLPQSLDGTDPKEWAVAEPIRILEKRMRDGIPLPSGFPKVFIPVGERDPVLEDSIRLSKVLEHEKIAHELKIYPESTHGFYALPWDPEAARCWSDIGRFLHQSM